jgi:hypothetical protein
MFDLHDGSTIERVVWPQSRKWISKALKLEKLATHILSLPNNKRRSEENFWLGRLTSNRILTSGWSLILSRNLMSMNQHRSLEERMAQVVELPGSQCSLWETSKKG